MSSRDSIVFRGMNVIPDKYVADLQSVPRTWKERLFEKPWRPFAKTKHVRESGLFYQVDDNTYLCSYETYDKILKAIEAEPEKQVEVTKETLENAFLKAFGANFPHKEFDIVCVDIGLDSP